MAQGEEGEVRHLNEVLLRPLVVHASAPCVPCEIAEQVIGFAGWHVGYVHVLRAKDDEIGDRQIVVALNVLAKELAP